MGQMRHVLGREGFDHVIGDVQARNAVSLRVAVECGYIPVAYTTVRTNFMRFERERNGRLVGRVANGGVRVW